MENIIKKLKMLEYLITNSDNNFIIAVADDEDLKETIISTISSNSKAYIRDTGFNDFKISDEIKNANSDIKTIIFTSLEAFNLNYIYICQILDFNRDFYKDLNKNIILIMSSKMYVYFLRNAVSFSTFCTKFDFANLSDNYFQSDEFEGQYIKDQDNYIKRIKK